MLGKHMTEQTASLFELGPEAPLLLQALTHPSLANEQRDLPDNQRLEFLGDAVLGLCISELLYQRCPDADEGTLTRLRAQLVNAERLADWGRSQGLTPELRLGRGASAGGLRESTNVVADAVEACIAATYLENGLEAARRACARLVEPVLDDLLANGGRDPKSELQEVVQSFGFSPPLYEVIASGGPAHESWFEVRVGVRGMWLATARGRSKRQAERAAAAQVVQARGELLEPLVAHPTQPPEAK